MGIFDSNVKYITFDWPGKGLIPIIFPATIQHSDIVNIVNASHPGVKPIFAGFVRQALDGSFQCFGESKSIGKKSALGDTALLNSLLGEED